MLDNEAPPPADALTAAVHPDPFPYYRLLREHRPLYFDAALKLWVASSHAVVDEAFHHTALRVRPVAEPVPAALAGTAAGEVFSQLVRMTDGDFHAAHKPGVEQAAQRWSLADVARASEETLKNLGDAGANALLTMLPVQTMARLLGVPQEALERTSRWVGEFVLGIALGAPAQAVAQATVAAQALMDQGRALGLPAVQAANRIAFMQQSLDATAGLMGHTALMLARYPDAGRAADDSPAAMREFVAEVERYCAPIQNTRRFVAEPLTLAGQALQAGEAVLLVLASANRDEALNPLPDVFDPRRVCRRSMGFGAGAHACPGAAIAIEIVAAASRALRAQGRLDAGFGVHTGYRPLANARIPVFAD